MKHFMILILSFFTLSAFAVELTFIGPCSHKFIMKVKVSENDSNVGLVTLQTLSKFSIPHEGTPENLISAFETPVRENAIEVLSQDEFRVYRWCFAIDGVAPEVYPHETPVSSETQSIVWTFGFAHFSKGEWLSQCTPAHLVRPDFLCKDPTVGDSP